jgi:hypothetical protein
MKDLPAGTTQIRALSLGRILTELRADAARVGAELPPQLTPP